MVFADRDSRGPRGGSGGGYGDRSRGRDGDRDGGGGYGGGSNLSSFGLPSSFGGSRYGKDMGAGQKLKKPRWDKFDLEPISKSFYKVGYPFQIEDVLKQVHSDNDASEVDISGDF